MTSTMLHGICIDDSPKPDVYKQVNKPRRPDLEDQLEKQAIEEISRGVNLV